jgi:hypothetical protein
MADRWLILADDLTGAAALCHRVQAKGTEHTPAVMWGEVSGAPVQRLPVLAYDAASRGLSADAAGRHAGVLACWRACSGRSSAGLRKSIRRCAANKRQKNRCQSDTSALLSSNARSESAPRSTGLALRLPT